MKNSEQNISNNFNVGEYCVYCCNVLYHIKDVDFKKCSRCGKILKDTRVDNENLEGIKSKNPLKWLFKRKL